MAGILSNANQAWIQTNEILPKTRELVDSLAGYHYVPHYLYDEESLALLQTAYEALRKCVYLLDLEQAPIHRLPDDLLLVIFTIARDSQDTGIDTVRTQIPFSVSCVSHAWRDVAFSAPLLWTKVVISPPWIPVTVFRHLYFSRPCLIDLEITSQPRMAFEPHHIPLLCDTIIQNLSRCRSIVISYPTNDAFFPSLMEKFKMLSAPHLVQLSILGHPSTSDSNAVILRGGTPSLRYARLQNFDCYPSLHTITMLHLRIMDSSAWFQVASALQLSPQLRSFMIFNDSPTLRTWGQVVDTPALKTLHLCGYVSIIEAAFSTIRAPNLVHLIVGIPDAGTTLRTVCSRVTAPHFPSLKSLMLLPWGLGSRPTEKAFRALWTCFPNIETLILAERASPREELRALLQSARESKTIWRNLKVLALEGALCRDAEDRLCEYVSICRFRDYPLATLYLKDASPHQMPRFKTLQSHIVVIPLPHYLHAEELVKGTHPLGYGDL
ncbi:hypothetical protein Hypma_005147 [Hypsizygus marmoreus]|uniref:Uncharacterized protein n=1 Tax=Hypsizygus marmoreus TaxID=39966 RepID=A0A369K2F7_HYPMA|nr:hypothetical protein Hypma_005147 [Hypsizygus marmoreus]